MNNEVARMEGKRKKTTERRIMKRKKDLGTHLALIRNPLLHYVNFFLLFLFLGRCYFPIALA